MPSFHDFRFLSTDGKHKVFARECTPDGEVRAVLQIAHGVAEHIYRYAPFMEFLANHGFAVVANDHLGHGKTAENEQELCFFAEKDGWNDVVSDMDQLHKLTAAKYPDVPYFLFGHSMGSFLTRTYIIDHPEGLKGVIISGTGQNPAAVVAAGKLMAKLEMIDNGPMYHSLPSAAITRNMTTCAQSSTGSPATKRSWISTSPTRSAARWRPPACSMI